MHYYLISDVYILFDIDIIIQMHTLPHKERHFRYFIDDSPSDVKLSSWEC